MPSPNKPANEPENYEQLVERERMLHPAVPQTNTPAADATPSGDDLLSPDDIGFSDEFEQPDVAVKRFTVLHGYGRTPPSKRHYVDSIEFIGGVAKGVHEDIVRAWRNAGRVKIHVLPDDATPVDYARKVGMTPMNPEKMAALLGAADMDQLVSVLGPGKTQALIAALHERLNSRKRVDEANSRRH